METSKIVLVSIALLIGVFFVSSLLKINHIKLFKKKGDKPKKGKSAEEKFRDIKPKEKQEKGKASFKPIVKDSAKDEKKIKGVVDPSHVMKVTADDFKKNDIKVPECMGGQEKKEQTNESKTKNNELKNHSNFDGGQNFKDILTPPTQKSAFQDLLQDKDFMFGDEVPGFHDSMNRDSDIDNIKELDTPFSDDELEQLLNNDFNKDFVQDFDFDTNPQNYSNTVQFVSNDIDRKIHEMFGNLDFSQMSQGAKEVVIGDILSSPKARSRRGLNNRRTIQY